MPRPLTVMLVLALSGCGDAARDGDVGDVAPAIDAVADSVAGDGAAPGDGVATGLTDAPDVIPQDTDIARDDADVSLGDDTDPTDVSLEDTDVVPQDSAVSQDTRVSQDTDLAADTTTTDVPADTVATDLAEDTATAPEAPLVAYAQSEPRRLFFLNNPEQLTTTELGDATLMDATLLRTTASGPSRSFFEHVNRSGRTLGFGIQLYNGGATPVTVTVRGVGFTVGIDGGAPFAAALNGAGAVAPASLAAGASVWILRRDESVPTGSFFSGVVDFDVDGGAVTVNHIAYDAFAGLDGSTAERDYVQRVEPDGTHEARMYKGVASASEVAFEPTFTLAADALPGPLPVRTRRWDPALADYAAAVPDDGWTSHIGPGQNAAATTSDMVSFAFRAWRFDPLAASDGEDRYPNLGNWGVVYRLRATLHNDGATARTVAWRVTASPGAGAGLATATGDDAWVARHLDAGESFTPAVVTVPAFGTAVLDAGLVLGGPSGGALRQALVLE